MEKMLAYTPPMGWNSWDCYGASVNEDEVRANAAYMAKHLKEFGWEYVVVDIQWYEPLANTSQYHAFTELEMDEYSRLMPAVNRFPSAKGGVGFKLLGDYIHELGLKFGIHIMRGIPRQAVHQNTKIFGSHASAREIAATNSISSWNTDMYGVDPFKEGAQAYYDSLFELYASWGVDFVKVDDIAKSFIGFSEYFDQEIEMIRKAIDASGRPMVLSLSPGPTPIECAEHVKQYATMWRMTNDYWDRWEDLLFEFEKCHEWSSHVGPGHWPDADMLPIGHLGIRSCEHGFGDRMTHFTQDEQLTMMTLWSIFRSPLMVGCELRDNDDFTLSLLTNVEVLRVLNHSHSAKQLYRRGNHVVWTSVGECGARYLALFNLGLEVTAVSVSLQELQLEGVFNVRDLWAKEDILITSDTITMRVQSHGTRLLKLTLK
ncbi:MAG: glycoside hydrolase family 27 protein [Turicibacter sp.]